MKDDNGDHIKNPGDSITYHDGVTRVLYFGANNKEKIKKTITKITDNEWFELYESFSLTEAWKIQWFIEVLFVPYKDLMPTELKFILL